MRYLRYFSLGCMVWFASLPAAVAQSDAAADACSVLARPMRAQHISVVAIAVFRLGQPALSACGSEESTDALVDANALTEPVVAYAVLELVREGRLDLDKPLALYAPMDAKAQSSVTARMVLAHLGADKRWSSSSSQTAAGMLQLQHAVEAITGKPMQLLLQQNVFLPLQMQHSSLTADGQLQTTLGDYAKFLESLLVVPLQDSPFGMEEQPQAVASVAAHVTWGLGLGLEDAHGKRAIFQASTAPGQSSFFLLVPETGNGFLMFTNSAHGLALVPEALQHFAPGHHPVLRFPLLRNQKALN